MPVIVVPGGAGEFVSAVIYVPGCGGELGRVG